MDSCGACGFDEAPSCCWRIPNQLGVDYNAHVLEGIVKLVAPELGWR